LSTATFLTAELVVLPAMSSTTTWIVVPPSAPVVVFQFSEKGAVESVPRSDPPT